ncbi:MAG: hypothetical protein J7K53_09070 [Bacteroidales bacterium]|nr:hypothetical protein [Bacteroidales bacterium]
MKITQINMVSWIFYFHLVLFSFIASVLIINGWADKQTALLDIGEEARLHGWLSVQYTMLAMPLGMLFINYLYGYKSNSKLFLSYINSPVTTLASKKDSFVQYPLYILSLISLLSVVYTFMSSHRNPIVEIFQGLDATSIRVLRQELTVEFAGINIIKNCFGVALTPTLSYVAFAYWRLTKLREHFIWFLIMFVFSIFILIFNLAKSPVAMFVLSFLFLNVLISGGIKKKTLFLYIGGTLILIVVAYIFVRRMTNFEDIFSAMGIRILLGQAIGTYYSFEYFPNQHDFLGLSSFPLPFSSALGMDVSDGVARIIMIIRHPVAVRAGVAGIMNSLFIQDAWGCFGFWGVIIAPIYVGMYVQIIYMFFLKSKKTPIMLGLLTYFSLKMPISSNFMNFLFNRYFVFLVFIFVSVYVVALFFKGFKKNMHESDVSLSNSA